MINVNFQMLSCYLSIISLFKDLLTIFSLDLSGSFSVLSIHSPAHCHWQKPSCVVHYLLLLAHPTLQDDLHSPSLQSQGSFTPSPGLFCSHWRVLSRPCCPPGLHLKPRNPAFSPGSFLTLLLWSSHFNLTTSNPEPPLIFLLLTELPVAYLISFPWFLYHLDPIGYVHSQLLKEKSNNRIFWKDHESGSIQVQKC